MIFLSVDLNLQWNFRCANSTVKCISLKNNLCVDEKNDSNFAGWLFRLHFKHLIRITMWQFRFFKQPLHFSWFYFSIFYLFTLLWHEPCNVKSIRFTLATDDGNDEKKMLFYRFLLLYPKSDEILIHFFALYNTYVEQFWLRISNKSRPCMVCGVKTCGTWFHSIFLM